jgi:uncharacterized protein
LDESDHDPSCICLIAFCSGHVGGLFARQKVVEDCICRRQALEFRQKMKLNLWVRPNAKIDKIIEDRSSFVITTKAPAKNGKANKSVIKLLAKHLAIAQSRIKIVSGFTNRNKVAEID